MSLKNTVSLYLLTLAIFFLVDMLWLGLAAKDFYRRQLGGMLRPTVIWPAAILFYLLFVAGLLLFIIVPALDPRAGALQALWRGAFFGLVTYATYDLTNLATLRGWPLAVTAVDLAWGAVLGGAVSFLAALAGARLFKG